MKGNDTTRSAAGPVTLDLGLCKACGICVAICPRQVYDRDSLGRPVIARADECIQCLRCELHCPDFAIEIRRRERKRTAAAQSAPPRAARDAVPQPRHADPPVVPSELPDAGIAGDEGAD